MHQSDHVSHCNVAGRSVLLKDSVGRQPFELSLLYTHLQCHTNIAYQLSVRNCGRIVQILTESWYAMLRTNCSLYMLHCIRCLCLQHLLCLCSFLSLETQASLACRPCIVSRLTTSLPSSAERMLRAEQQQRWRRRTGW